MKKSKLIELAITSGATKAVCISQEQIILNEGFRKICENNQCGQFSKCWVCPPSVGDIHALMTRVRNYDTAVLYQTITSIEDSFDIEGMQNAARNHALLGQRINNALGVQTEPFLHLGCGGCHLCERCTKQDNLPCVFPKNALIPLEACGIDVYNTVKSTSLKYINGQNTVTYFGMVLFQEK